MKQQQTHDDGIHFYPEGHPYYDRQSRHDAAHNICWLAAVSGVAALALAALKLMGVL